MTADALRAIAAIRATWPPAALDRAGPFEVPTDTAGGRRNRAIRLTVPGGAFEETDLDAALALRPGQPVGTLDGIEDALADALDARGFAPEGESALMLGPAAPLLGDPPPVSGVAHWPPVALVEAMWAAHDNGPEKLAVAARAPDPKAAILMRAGDRAAGALFVAVADGAAALHMVLTLPDARRRGVGMLGMRHAARFAARHGADALVLPVERTNAPARALYARAGLREVGGYRYWRPTGDRA